MNPQSLSPSLCTTPTPLSVSLCLFLCLSATVEEKRPLRTPVGEWSRKDSVRYRSSYETFGRSNGHLSPDRGTDREDRLPPTTGRRESPSFPRTGGARGRRFERTPRRRPEPFPVHTRRSDRTVRSILPDAQRSESKSHSRKSEASTSSPPRRRGRGRRRG